MIAIVPSFIKLFDACKKKFNMLFTQYKFDKMTNGKFGEKRHEWKFDDSND